MRARTDCKTCGRRLNRRGRGGMHDSCKRCTAKADREVARTVQAKCRECGKKFTAANRRAIYCSDKCRTDGARRYQREYRRRYLADPEKLAMALARKRACASADAARKRGGRPPPPRWPPRIDPNAEQPTCRLCGRKYARYTNTRRNAYCKPCRDEADREIARELRVKCRACGRAFDTTKRSVRYCSDACRAVGARRRPAGTIAGARPIRRGAP